MSLREGVARVIGTNRNARLLTLGTVLAVAIAVAAFIALDSDDSSDPSDDYLGEADVICIEGKRDLAQAGDRIFDSGPDPLPPYARVALRITGETRSRFEELEPPDELRDRASAFATALAELGVPLRQLEQAASAVDPSGIQNAVSEIGAASGRADRAADALGLEQCPRLAVGLQTLERR